VITRGDSTVLSAGLMTKDQWSSKKPVRRSSAIYEDGVVEEGEEGEEGEEAAAGEDAATPATTHFNGGGGLGVLCTSTAVNGSFNGAGAASRLEQRRSTNSVNFLDDELRAANAPSPAGLVAPGGDRPLARRRSGGRREGIRGSREILAADVDDAMDLAPAASPSVPPAGPSASELSAAPAPCEAADPAPDPAGAESQATTGGKEPGGAAGVRKRVTCEG